MDNLWLQSFFYVSPNQDPAVTICHKAAWEGDVETLRNEIKKNPLLKHAVDQFIDASIHSPLKVQVLDFLLVEESIEISSRVFFDKIKEKIFSSHIEDSTRGCLCQENERSVLDEIFLKLISQKDFIPTELDLKICIKFACLKSVVKLLEIGVSQEINHVQDNLPQLSVSLYAGTPLHLAASEGHFDIIQAVLKSNRYSLLDRDQSGRIPLMTYLRTFIGKEYLEDIDPPNREILKLLIPSHLSEEMKAHRDLSGHSMYSLLDYYAQGLDLISEYPEFSSCNLCVENEHAKNYFWRILPYCHKLEKIEAKKCVWGMNTHWEPFEMGHYTGTKATTNLGICLQFGASDLKLHYNVAKKELDIWRLNTVKEIDASGGIFYSFYALKSIFLSFPQLEKVDLTNSTLYLGIVNIKELFSELQALCPQAKIIQKDMKILMVPYESLHLTRLNSFYSVGREEAEKLLLTKEKGGYLFRRSSIPEKFVLSFKEDENRIIHHLISIGPKGIKNETLAQHFTGCVYPTHFELVEVAVGQHAKPLEKT